MLQNNNRPSAARMLIFLVFAMLCTICVYPHLYFAKSEPPGENVLFIPSAGIHSNLTMASYTQEAVDNYDVIYSLDNGENNPFILGHDYKTLSRLHKTQVGDYIYISIAGKVEAYRVVASEYAREASNKRDIVGQETGANLWDSYSEKTLHVFTCHGWREDGRWLVLAILDSDIKALPQKTEQ